ncbi:MAG TPA: D-alanine--D-alanine ligase [Deltaproteobacteria bacterium]|nr:MAG: D-alanine--D-alanine ligase [Deltaproteobacteria bacterium GWA2_55_82]OGQ62682.1 MAG: D-alanine--D-alanine ligase [Deltaproteobacteria bacterium RIFCSPLOWO2_02_FULL_55_12]OIJ74274.1 MAG: D-alanine--D-alanine ligase [Deltaproteobacteria bacterium GWC2_55_46]HBG46908.1 D-alanine--D-alanine ligase [Deltaproteobacteria bacterium]HCY11034.1 D-alanine--D-alanine ligase [Deltaproteobacteria bacterium]
MRVALTYNLKKDLVEAKSLPSDFYAECDEPETIQAVRDALAERHEEVAMVEADEDAFEKLRRLKPDIVFNMAEGLWGESREAQIPAVLEMLRIPYTGSNPLTLGLCLNKARAKEVLAYYGIPTARFVVAAAPSLEIEKFLTFPMIVKPLFEGSSKGIKNDSIVHTPSELKKKVASVLEEYSQPALVEEYLSGREFTVALMGNGEGLKVLPIVEINYSALPAGVNHIYSYEAKWVLDTPDAPLDIFTCPAQIPDRLKSAIEAVSRDAFKSLDVKDWCRIDVRLDSSGVPHVIELNPLPGILMDPKCNSCFPKAARAAGMSFSSLVNGVLDAARGRFGL